MMVHENMKIVEHAIWIVSNCMVEADAPFQEIFDTEIIDVVTKLLSNSKVPLTLLRVMTWSISNMAKWKIRTIEFIGILIELGSTAIFSPDEDTVIDAVFLFKHLTDVEEEDEKLELDKLNSISETHIVNKLFQCLDVGNKSFSTALRVIGNFSSSDWDLIQQQLCKNGFYQKAAEMIAQGGLQPSTIKELFWITSNLISSGEKYGNEYYSSALFEKTINYIQEQPMNDVKREAIWCICNLVEKTGTEVRMELVAKHSFVTFLIEVIKEAKNNGKTTEIILLSMDKLLETGKHFREDDQWHPLYTFQNEGGIDLFEELQLTPNARIFSLAQKNLKKYYPEGTEQEMYPKQDIEKVEESPDDDEEDLEF